MEGWNGKDEDSVPAINMFLCRFGLCMGFERSYIQKLVVSLQWTGSIIQRTVALTTLRYLPACSKFTAKLFR